MNRQRVPWIGARALSVLMMALVVMVAISGGASSALAWGWGHKWITQWAVERLPDWQQDYFGPDELAKLSDEYRAIQDTYSGSKSAELKPYVDTPGVGARLHDVHAIGPSVVSIKWLVQQVIDRMAAGEPDEAMKYLGVLCHWHEDPGSPTAHASPISESMWRWLLPPANDQVQSQSYIYGYKNVGLDVYEMHTPDEAYTPRLLGSTLDEAAARMYQDQRLLAHFAASRILRLLVAVNDNDQATRDALMTELALYNGRHVANIIYTVGCLASGNIDAAEDQQNQSQDLAAWLPNNYVLERGALYSPPYHGVPFLVNQSYTPKRAVVPLAFIGEERVYDTGFGVGANGVIQFTIAPGRVFDRFEAMVGLHASAGKDARVSFVVEKDGQEIARVGPMSVGDGGRAIEAVLAGDDKIDLTLRCENATGSPLSQVVGVWASPRLHRASTDENQTKQSD